MADPAPEDRVAERRAEIEAVALDMLRERGYQATSMLAVARAAKASNETLYRWYGGKQGLFAALVQRNARRLRDTLRGALDDEAGDPVRRLRQIGPMLLAMVVGETAVLLNRAAAADAGRDGALGQALARGGREAIVPLLAALFRTIGQRGRLRVRDGREARTVAGLYLDLLLGDLQIRRVTGVLPPLSPAEIRRRADRAWQTVERLYGQAVSGDDGTPR